MSKKKILVTGASGFVGSHLAEYLIAQGHEVHGTTSQPSEWLVETLGSSAVHIIDLSQKDEVSDLIAALQPDWVFHLAAMAFVGESFSRALEVMENNTRVQFAMLEAIREHAPACRVLCVGSATEYGPLPRSLAGENVPETAQLYPNNPYAVSKMTQDFLSLSYFIAYKVDVIRVRPFNQIGPRQNDQFAIASFAKQIVAIEQGRQPELLVGNLEAIRDFTDVRDAVRAYVLLMEQGEPGEVYNIGSGKGISIHAVLDELRGLAKTDIMVRRDDARLRPVDVAVFTANIDRLKKLGWEPKIPLHQTLQDILEYERKQKI